MKNILLTCVFAIMGITVWAQEGLKLGFQAGLPLGDYNDQVGVVLGLDAGYMWAPNKVFDLGVKAGYIYGFPEKFRSGTILVDLPSIQFAPIAASVRIWPSRSFSFGADIGQAFGLNEGNDGGFYYRPQIGFLMGAQTELNFSYTGINQDQESFSLITMGLVYTFLSARSYR
ncbi:MAG: hypothetical protein MUO53_14955 [Maribacter sp.]|nr:hypothetical protein [Maribacter sp.]